MIHLNSIYLDEELKYHSFGSRFYMSINEFKENYFYSFRTIFTLIFAPWSLKSLHSHLFTGFPMFLCFSLLFSYTLFKYSERKVAVILFVIFITSPIFIDSKYGIGVFWLDTAPSFLLLSSLICIYNWNKNDHLRWLFLGGVLFSISIMSRYLFCVFGFFTISPYLVYLLVNKNKYDYRKFLKPISFFILGILPSIPFVIYNFNRFINYYIVQDYGYGGTIFGALQSYSFIPFLLIFILKTNNTFHLYNTTYILFGFFLLFVAENVLISRKIFLSFLILLSISTIYSFSLKLNPYKNGDAISRGNKMNEVEIADYFFKIKSDKIISVYSCLNEKHIYNLNLEYFIRSNKQIVEKGENSFFTNDAVWKFASKGKNLTEKSNLIFKSCLKNQFVIFYKSLKKKDTIFSDNTKWIHQRVKMKIEKSQKFQIVKEISSKDVPEVLVYKNLQY
ncbi:MAG: hypothetical protein HYR91_12040 [Flavobacteriia bacterium]|nr:hypothetical protein [Flavobacteriia bacterium]